MILQRLINLTKTLLKNFVFMKYTRDHLLNVYDDLHNKDDFRDQNVN